MSGQLLTPLAITAISGAGTTTSSVLSVLNAKSYAMTALASGNLVGTYKIQGSTDNVTYNDLDGLLGALDGAGQSSIMLEDVDMGYAFIQAVFTYTSGAGNLTITASVHNEV